MTHVRLSSRVPPGSSTHLSEGILSETLDDGQLVVFTFLNLAISTVDSAMEALDALLRRCDEAGRPLRLLLDLSAPEPILNRRADGGGPDARRQDHVRPLGVERAKRPEQRVRGLVRPSAVAIRT